MEIQLKVIFYTFRLIHYVNFMAEIKKYKVRYVTDEKGNKTEVIIKMKDYEELLEDLNDLAIVAERRDEKVIAHEEVLDSLKKTASSYDV